MPFKYTNPHNPETEWKAYNDYKNIVETAYAEAYAESFMRLYEKGLVERCEKDNGFVKDAIAERMKRKNYDWQQIAKVTGLSERDIYFI